MSEASIIRGVVHLIEETKTYGQKGFRKRLVVLEKDNGRFTNHIPIDFLRDACDTVDEMKVGDEVEISYQLSGRKWQKEQLEKIPPRPTMRLQNPTMKATSRSRGKHLPPLRKRVASRGVGQAVPDDGPAQNVKSNFEPRECLFSQECQA